ncbi:hypothetical protein PFISCL1PPCAC_17123, partial [Pristionchus fissidentatus]
VTSVAGEVFFIFSTTFPERWVISVFSTVFSNSFVIICFHFLYRYIAVCRPPHLPTFRKWWCVALLFCIFIAESIVWFTLVYVFLETDLDTFVQMYSHLSQDYPYLTAHSAATSHYWVKVLGIVILCGAQIYRSLDGKIASDKAIAMQRQLYYTLLAQFCVPFFMMYLPVLVAIVPPLLGIYLSFPDRLLPTMFSVFPSLDALVIMLGVQEYRCEINHVF